MVSEPQMADSSTSNGPQPPSSPQFPSPLMLLSNMSNLMSIKLDSLNYMVWKLQLTTILEAYSMIDHIDGSVQKPSQYLVDSAGLLTTGVNPSFLSWKKRDKALLTLIYSTLSPPVLSMVVGLHSAQEVWSTLETRFTSTARANVLNLKLELQSVKKGSDSISAYMQRVKTARDKLFAVGVQIDDEEMLHMVLKGLPKDYSSFNSAIRTRDDSLTFEKLSVLLQTEELSINESSELNSSLAMFVSNTNRQTNGSSNYNRGRGRSNYSRGGRGNGRSGHFYSQNQFTQNHSPGSQGQNQSGFHGQNTSGYNKPEHNRPTCQICGKLGHYAIDYYHRMDFAYQGKNPPTKLAAMANASNLNMTQGTGETWLTDSGASDHITADLNNLNQPTPFKGPEQVSVGNGQNLPIQNIDFILVLVDDYTKFCWVYLLKHKSDAFSTFTQFKLMAEKHHQSSIHFLRTDCGGEFTSNEFNSFCANTGIIHHLTCPHTPQQNGVAERTHRHLVQCTLALLSQSGLPLSYWSYALATATHLINKLPTPLLHMSSPWEQLHNAKPNFSYLKTFGCKCFPLLSPYNTHKLQPKTIPCIFLGYPPTTKGYLCQDPISKRLYISRHVLFNETEFPALKPDMHTTSQPSVPNSYSPDSWFTHLLSTHTCTSCPHSTGPIPFDQNLPSQSLIDPSTAFIHPSNFQPIISDHLAAHTPPVTNPHPQPAHTNIPAPNSANISTLASDSPDTSIPACVSADHSIPAPPIPPSLPTLSNTHPMQTRSKHGIFKPKPCYTAHLDYAFTEPPNFKIASQLSQWCQAMKDEYDALIKQATWSLVPPPPNHNVVGCKWVYKLKTHSDGSIARYKARLVAKGFHQQQGVDFDETFSPVIKPPTVRMVLSLAVSLNWPLRQLDVSNAFLHGILKEEVYMSQPQGYIDPQHPHYVCKLHKSIYGLKQAPRAWFERFTGQLLQFGFAASTADSSLFIYRTKTTIAYLLLYVDDIVLTSNTPTFLDHLIHHLRLVFDLKDLGPLNYFLGIQVTRDSTGLHLSQAKYATTLLHKHQMLHTKLISTPCIPNTRLSLHDGTKLHDPHAYRSLVGALHYLTFTRPDLSFAVHQVCQYMASPTSVHLMAAKRILRYLKGTLHLGISFKPGPLTLSAFTDADWTGDPDDRRSTSGLLVYLGPNPITWSANKQLTVSRSSTESEYRALALASAELCWFRTLLKDLGVFISAAPILWCDNISALAIASNPVFHARTKHIEVDFHFVRERVLRKDLAVKFVSTLDQLADIFTKSLPPHRFLALRSHLMATVRPPELEEGC
uniref:Integrase catalytic domain-containing protein n=1 Tax=Fagus sylvatica TaxID=28930 RepID=A0A2N9FVX2_FAGSY